MKMEQKQIQIQRPPRKRSSNCEASITVPLSRALLSEVHAAVSRGNVPRSQWVREAISERLDAVLGLTRKIADELYRAGPPDYEQYKDKIKDLFTSPDTSFTPWLWQEAVAFAYARYEAEHPEQVPPVYSYQR